MKAMKREIAFHAKKSAPRISRETAKNSVTENAKNPASEEGANIPAGATSGREPSSAAKNEREHIAAAVEAAVRARDGNRCQWPCADGDVCGSGHQVELEHRIPVARGGKSTVENLWQVCRLCRARHNRQYAAFPFMPRLAPPRSVLRAGAAAMSPANAA